MDKKFGIFLIPLSLIIILNTPTKNPEQNRAKNKKSNFVKFGYLVLSNLNAFLLKRIIKKEIKTNKTPKLIPNILKCLNPYISISSLVTKTLNSIEEERKIKSHIKNSENLFFNNK